MDGSRTAACRRLQVREAGRDARPAQGSNWAQAARELSARHGRAGLIALSNARVIRQTHLRDGERVQYAGSVPHHLSERGLRLYRQQLHAIVHDGGAIVNALVVFPNGNALVHAVARYSIDNILLAYARLGALILCGAHALLWSHSRARSALVTRGRRTLQVLLQ